MPERPSLGSKQSSRRVTLRDVAREAGVSIATASRVLNGSPSVSPSTREDVLRVFARLEFAPDPLARALNAGGTNTVGAVIPTINHAIFAAFLEALEAGLDANGYRLLIATT
ncbi:MAG: LacI family DNA-binding transcriptional regulator, partial [Rhodospirillaceae bacterium]|nr:LacI family DNA-binding transcriptional regulator [Rhodospirillaceae bacterium]